MASSLHTATHKVKPWHNRSLERRWHNVYTLQSSLMRGGYSSLQSYVRHCQGVQQINWTLEGSFSAAKLGHNHSITCKFVTRTHQYWTRLRLGWTGYRTVSCRTGQGRKRPRWGPRSRHTRSQCAHRCSAWRGSSGRHSWASQHGCGGNSENIDFINFTADFLWLY